ncbi:MAG TPA: S1 RNA-binding domain-containing protein, partial [Ktedonobacteraceae bacterium]
PWTTVEQRYQPGQVVNGVVTKIAPFGAFARIEDGIEGLIHQSELPSGLDPKTVLYEGSQLQLRILRIEPERRRLGLSLRQAEEMDAQQAEDKSAQTQEAQATEAAVPAGGEQTQEGQQDQASNSAAPSLEALSSGDQAANKRDRRERQERENAQDNSLLSGLSGGEELTAMAEAFRAAARQQRTKDEAETSES